MKCADIHLVDVDLRTGGEEFIRNSGQQFPRRLFGESHCHDLTGCDVFLKHEISYSFYEREGLARSGSGNDKDRPVGCCNCLLLIVVHAGKIKHKHYLHDFIGYPDRFHKITDLVQAGLGGMDPDQCSFCFISRSCFGRYICRTGMCSDIPF